MNAKTGFWKSKSF